MGNEPIMGGTLTYYYNEEPNNVILQRNMKFSYGQKKEGAYTASDNHSVFDTNGTLHYQQQKFSINGSTAKAFETIIGTDGKLTESDLLSLHNKPRGNIKKVTCLDNGIYEVEYKLGFGSSYDTAFMQFDFETEDERVAREQKEQVEAQEKQKQQAELQKKKEAEAKKAEEDRIWKEEYNDPISRFLKWLGF